jgi:hypothetical protein
MTCSARSRFPLDHSSKIRFASFAGMLAVAASPSASRAAVEAAHYYYCAPTRAYYPFAKSCPVPWQEVEVKPGATAGAPAEPGPDAAAPRVEPAAARAQPAEPPKEEENGGKVVFAADTPQPTITCALQQICDVTLQAGERVKSMILGDTTRWAAEVVAEGSEPHLIEHLILRPLDTGEDTSMVVTTTVRSYHLRLRTHRSVYMTQVTFSYPAEAATRSATIAAEAAQPAQPAETAAQDAGGDTVVIDGLTYVMGREPKSLVPKTAAQSPEPPAPAAAPRPKVDVDR